MSLSINAQIVFSDDMSKAKITIDSDSLMLLFVPDSSLGDISPFANTLTFNSFTDTNLVANSPLKDGGTTLQFDGTDDYISFTQALLNLGTNESTVLYIVNPDDRISHHGIVAKSFGSSNRWTASLRASGDGSDISYNMQGAALSSSDRPADYDTLLFAKYVAYYQFDKGGAGEGYLTFTNNVQTSNSSGNNIGTQTNSDIVTIGRAREFSSFPSSGFQNMYLDGYLAALAVVKDSISLRESKEWGIIPEGWVSTHGNVLRDLSVPEFFLTAFSDTLVVPLPNSTLGTNQEWKFTLSNIDTITAWIGSRASKKSVEKTIPGGAAFGSNTVYFGDGFSLSGDSLVISFPADTASVDNVVLSKASHHLLNSVNQRNNLNGYGDY